MRNSDKHASSVIAVSCRSGYFKNSFIPSVIMKGKNWILTQENTKLTMVLEVCQDLLTVGKEDESKIQIFYIAMFIIQTVQT